MGQTTGIISYITIELIIRQHSIETLLIFEIKYTFNNTIQSIFAQL